MKCSYKDIYNIFFLLSLGYYDFGEREENNKNIYILSLLV